MAQLDTLLPYIVPQVPGCPEPLIKQTVQQVVRHFARQTETYETELTFDTVADQAAYDIQNVVPGATQAMVYRIMSVQSEDSSVPYLAEDYTVSMGRVLTFVTAMIPAETGTTMTVKVVLLPNLNWTLIDPDYFNYHVEAFTAGVLAQLFSMPNSWGNMDKAVLNSRLYNRCMGEAIDMRLKGQKHTLLRASPRGWY